MSIVKSLRGQLAPIHPEGYQVRRRLRRRDARPVVALGAARLARPHRDALVRLFLSRSRARHAGPRRPRRRARRRRGQLRRLRRAAARARPRHGADAAGVDLHVGLRLPREPRAGRGPRRADRLSARACSSTPISTRRARTTSATAWSSMPPSGRFGVVQIAGLVARRIVCFTQEGALLGAGERFGLIRFGSRVDVYLPDGRAHRGRRRFARHRRRDGDRAGRRATSRRAVSAELTA